MGGPANSTFRSTDMRPMITNGGPHPADLWAEVTTDAILDLIEIKDNSDTPAAAEARAVKRDLRPVLFDIFNGHHGKVQEEERTLVPVDPHAHVAATIDITSHFGVAREVFDALAATPFAAHFAKLEVREVIEQI